MNIRILFSTSLMITAFTITTSTTNAAAFAEDIARGTKEISFAFAKTTQILHMAKLKLLHNGTSEAEMAGQAARTAIEEAIKKVSDANTADNKIIEALTLAEKAVENAFIAAAAVKIPAPGQRPEALSARSAFAKAALQQVSDAKAIAAAAIKSKLARS